MSFLPFVAFILPESVGTRLVLNADLYSTHTVHVCYHTEFSILAGTVTVLWILNCMSMSVHYHYHTVKPWTIRMCCWRHVTTICTDSTIGNIGYSHIHVHVPTLYRAHGVSHSFWLQTYMCFAHSCSTVLPRISTLLQSYRFNCSEYRLLESWQDK